VGLGQGRDPGFSKCARPTMKAKGEQPSTQTAANGRSPLDGPPPSRQRVVEASIESTRRAPTAPPPRRRAKECARGGEGGGRSEWDAYGTTPRWREETPLPRQRAAPSARPTRRTPTARRARPPKATSTRGRRREWPRSLTDRRVKLCELRTPWGEASERTAAGN